MSILQEIRNQSPLVRHAMYWLSLVATLGVIGFFWLSSVERTMFFALHQDPADRQQFVDQHAAHVPQPLALITRGFGSLTASIATLIGFDQSKGVSGGANFDNSVNTDHNQGDVHLLPLSQ